MELTSMESDESQLVHSVTVSLPRLAVESLLSRAVCARCIFRLFGVAGRVYASSYLSTSHLYSSIRHVENDRIWEGDGCEGLCNKSEDEPLCRVCLGILQFTHKMEGEISTDEESKDHLRKFVKSIAQVIDREGHQFDGFSLEVSLPAVIVETEAAVRSDMSKKFGSENWFQDKLLLKSLSVKECLKLSITYPLKNLLAVESGVDSLHISLSYSCSVDSLNFSAQRDPSHKRSKAGTRGGLCYDSGSDIRSPELMPCTLICHCYKPSIYICGRYLKFSRNVSQTCWIINNKRVGETSVEEIIGRSILPSCRGERYKFHAAGREDIDVRMLGSGRPFLVEIVNPHCVPTSVELKQIENEINNAEGQLVGIRKLRVVGDEVWALMREGEAEKRKQYMALIWIPRPLTTDDVQNISSVKDMEILQRTPIRVLHRRSPLVRKKIIHWMKVQRVHGRCQYFLLQLCTQAGTYIKEFVHGDLGRTHPSIGSILECQAEILQLDVTDVKMDNLCL